VGTLDLTHNWAGITALIVFVLAYSLVISEEFTHLRKSKAVMLAAGVIWAVIGIQYSLSGHQASLEPAIRDYLVEFAQLFLFLLAAMTYVNSMNERGVFDALRAWLIGRGFSLRKMFWVTGIISFFLSALIDNLTTALVMSGVILAVGKDNKRFVSLSCVNIVVAANAGGAANEPGNGHPAMDARDRTGVRARYLGPPVDQLTGIASRTQNRLTSSSSPVISQRISESGNHPSAISSS
jgi:Na+/H+ antiporter NhaD/arsenite permease-like protein